MKLLSCFFILIGILSWEVNSLNINDTNSDLGFIGDIAGLLVGSASSNYPGPSFLNFVLYGSRDAGFFYYHYITSYGYKVNTSVAGDLIIGNDGLLGGIVILGNQLVVPIPGDKVTALPISQLSKYFLKGYTILRNDNKYTSRPYSGNIFGKFGTVNFCQPCFMSILSYNDTNMLTPQAVVYLNQATTATNNYIDFYGYMQQFNNSTQKGVMMMSFYSTSSNYGYSILDPANDNSIHFVIDTHKALVFNGNIFLNFSGKSNFYNFTAVMH